MLALVTGAAGFIGSTLSERLLADGWEVRGIDSFTDYYDVDLKRSNVTTAGTNPRFTLVAGDLLTTDLPALLADVTVVFHLAGQPGVRLSWADGFRAYSDLNVLATQRLLDACTTADLRRFVYASSSSVYGDTAVVPTAEDQPTRPYSPYGVTKLAAEHLCNAYANNFDVPTVSLRYFTVYGPRQRPDMATHRLINAALDGTRFPLFGDGSQIRDFTFVDDIVDANVRAALSDAPAGTVCNAAGGGSTRLLDLVELVGRLAGRPVDIDWQQSQRGDVRQTGGSIELAEQLLGWRPQVDLEQGVARQLEHQQRQRR